ncbi:MAG: hypothetical protein CBB92_13240 [Flammeovirgaceae bacterium TMED32]|nr:MAG: hypothetical protein CBB92_13240 [Flammeovirgaceae bacterium TMED32]
MKYRRLTLEELKPLENEFIDFLVVNGVIADNWKLLLANDVEKSNQIIDAFSEVVFEGIMRKTQFLEYRSVGELITFSCMADLIYMAGIRLDPHGDEEIDFNDEHAVTQLLAQPIGGVKVYMDEKKYKENREKEIFEMVEQGCLISNGKLFKAIACAAAD